MGNCWSDLSSKSLVSQPPPEIKMLEYFPLEIQVEIMKRLPVKSLLQFRSVSKRWKSLIDSCEFIGGYGVHKTQPRRLLVWYGDPNRVPKRYNDPWRRFEKYVSLVDDVTYTQEEFPPTVPVLAELLLSSHVIGSSCGLLLLYGYYSDHPDCKYGRKMAVIWNPSIRKSVGVTVTADFDLIVTDLGFGVCPITRDPIILKITKVRKVKSRTRVPKVFEVFKLSAGRWRTLSGILPNNSIVITWGHVSVDRFICWLAHDKMDDDDDSGGYLKKFFIMSFDMTTEEFRTIDLPDSLAHQHFMKLSIFKVAESLAVLEYIPRTGTRGWDVWIMDHGFPNSWTNLFTIINVPDRSLRRVVGFTERREPIIESDHVPRGRPSSIIVYEPCSRHIKDIGIVGDHRSFYAGSYMETLLLQDQSDSCVYVENSVGPMDFLLWMKSMPKKVWNVLRHKELHPPSPIFSLI